MQENIGTHWKEFAPIIGTLALYLLTANLIGIFGVIEDVLFLRRAVEYDVPFLVRQLVERDVSAHSHLPAHICHKRPHQCVPRCDRPIIDTYVPVRYKSRFIHCPDGPGAIAFRTGALAVE